jgi:DNA-binding MarR family transcriptional regulator
MNIVESVHLSPVPDPGRIGLPAHLAQAVFDERVQRFGHLLEAFTKLERQIGAALLDAVGISHSWFEVLERIASAPDQQLTMSELRRRLALTSGGVTRFIDRIVEAGLIARIESVTDRRANLARLTDKGWSLLESALTVHTAAVDAALGVLTGEERGVLDALLLKLMQ